MTANEYFEKKESILSSCSYNTVCDFNSCLSDKCASCENRCCNNCPCTLSPKEFLDIDDIDYMKTVLDTGVLALTPGNIACNFYIIRPRGTIDFDTIVTGYVDVRNSCILQGPKGCVLDSLTRPTDGLLYIPHIEYGEVICKPHYSPFKVIEEYEKHQKVLKELVKIYKDIEIEKPEANEETAKKYTLALLGCKKETN